MKLELSVGVSYILILNRLSAKGIAVDVKLTLFFLLCEIFSPL